VNRSTRRKPHPSPKISTTNLTWACMVSNPVLGVTKLGTIRHMARPTVTVGTFDGGEDGSVNEGISVWNRLSPEEGGGMWPLCQQYFKNIKDVIGLYIFQWWSPTVERTKCFWLYFQEYQICNYTTTYVKIVILSRFPLL